jgi:cytochrome c peroxidase
MAKSCSRASARAPIRFLLLAGLAAALPALACTPTLKGTTLESPRYALAFSVPEISLGKHFSVEIAACAKPGNPAPETLRVDAQMPEHRHGMNYAPTVTPAGPGRWRAEGLLFHMQGRWEFVFELRGAGRSDVLRSSFVLGEVLDFSASEKAAILRHGPWPPKLVADPSNRVSGKPEAIALGEKLFFEPRLSGTGTVLCATCHVPFRGFQDGRALALGIEEVDRNTPSLLDVRFGRWFGWDGGQDSLWAQSIRPLLDPKEMKASAPHVAAVVKKLFGREYETAFGAAPASDEETLVNVGKALAAYQETLVSGRTPFDDFRDALERGDSVEAGNYPPAAQRGLRIFIGKGNCSVCHFGPNFSNGEFADIGIRFFTKNNSVDPGRLGGIRRLKESPYSLLGRFNDDRSGVRATGTKHVEAQHRNFGEWRVPGLRNVARTAPYMHNGSLATLRDVAAYYSNVNEDRLHADGEKILRPLRLSDEELSDLVAFLESLSSKP